MAECNTFLAPRTSHLNSPSLVPRPSSLLHVPRPSFFPLRRPRRFVAAVEPHLPGSVGLLRPDGDVIPVHGRVFAAVGPVAPGESEITRLGDCSVARLPTDVAGAGTTVQLFPKRLFADDRIFSMIQFHKITVGIRQQRSAKARVRRHARSRAVRCQQRIQSAAGVARRILAARREKSQRE